MSLHQIAFCTNFDANFVYDSVLTSLFRGAIIKTMIATAMILSVL